MRLQSNPNTPEANTDESFDRSALYVWMARIHLFIAWACNQPQSSFQSFKSVEKLQKAKAESLAILVFWTLPVSAAAKFFDFIFGFRPHPAITITLIFALAIWSWWFSTHIDKSISSSTKKSLNRLGKYAKWSLTIAFIISIPITFYLSALLLRP